MAVLKEYLVALGFKIDDVSYAKFMGAAAKTASIAALIATEAIAAATAIGIFTERVARNFSDLYYAAQRNETTVAGLQRIQYGFSQIGLSADQGRASVERLNEVMRLSPGVASLVKGITGENDPEKALPKLIDHLRKKYGPNRYFGAAAEATGIFGLDEQSFRAMWQNNEKLKEQVARRQEMEQKAGIDPDKLADESQKFITQINQLLERLGVLKDRVFSDLIGPASKVVAAMDKVVDTLTSVTKWMSETFVRGEGLFGEYKKVRDKPGDARDQHGAVVNAMGGFGMELLLTLSRVLRKISDWRDANEEKKVGTPDEKAGGGFWPTGIKNLLPGSSTPTKSSAKAWGDDEAIAAGIYDPPALKTGGTKPVTVNQRTEINIAPGPTARATADAVADRQQRINGDLVRNTAGATR